jgi:MoaA/NifB/PqqE/SkfB family radical SAM enzyme
MCHIWQHPSDKSEEITARDFEKLPRLDFVNITGGEPFLRQDLEDILDVVETKTSRIVISTNGFLTDRIVKVMEGRDKKVGVRVSLDGRGETHALMRGIPGAYDKAMRTVALLEEMGVSDLGIGITVSDQNAHDLLPLFKMAHERGLEFAIAAVHNGYYFHKHDNQIKDKDRVAGEFRKLIRAYFDTWKIKNWFRAYVANGIINYIYGMPRPLPCLMGTISFFVDPYGEIKACNVRDLPMGNLKETSFEEVWHSPKAEAVRKEVAVCPENCWMIGSVSCVMRKYIWKPALWVIRNRWAYNPETFDSLGGG